MSEEPVIKIENLSKQYRLGMIGGTTLREELQRFSARLRHAEDPTSKIASAARRREGLQEGDRFMALSDINLEIYRGERFGIIGRNGAGKSTLLKLLCRITAPTSGKISYNGRIASMLEVGTGFHPELTGRENIYLNGAILGMNRREIDTKISRIIEFSECEKFIDTPVKRYSSGMFVKLAFSVAAFLDAEIIIMDEVLAVGDAAFQQKCLKRMRELAEQEDRTILYVSHILPTVSNLCTRCIVLDQGRILYEGETADAINYYLENKVIADPSIDYTKTRKRRRGRFALQLLRASFEGKERAVFCDDESILLRLAIRYLEDCSGVSLRWEIMTPDGRPAATSLLEGIASGKAGEEQDFLLKYEFPELMPGRYDSRFAFYYRMQDGSYRNLEYAEGLSFEKKYVSIQGLRWETSRLGNIRLPSPTLQG
ncbi:MAG: ABC transporter ATP-binding protein [Lachnospiraceae bacterium]|nr:ABC transporter ATP-binding protein [Lachnospiraceae bacterium]